MTSVQAAFADVIDAALDDSYVVQPYPWAPDGPETGKTYVSIYRTVVTPAPNRQGARLHDLSIAVLSSISDPARADEALSDALDDVLDVLDNDPQLRGLVWSEARRTVVANYPAYEITTQVATTNNPEGS
ncbi:hypothetical protein [Jiangella alba]|uniref:DUF3168 domain-containing protein n=1 Tax=Jiangella alba TaxID=561176 RepID=A0A1H5PIS3_9ACTN|nr:hypothetical protein [Jiangella alba]SEF13793.1 hypothetical protein SAMN04488561_4476 [Jiangella alba]